VTVVGGVVLLGIRAILAVGERVVGEGVMCLAILAVVVVVVVPRRRKQPHSNLDLDEKRKVDW